MSNIKFNNISKRYDGSGDTLSVSNFNLEIKDKQLCVFVGPSGCGKSTTLRMIAGLEDITEGEILIDDELINDTPPKDRGIAMVFQNYALYPNMTVYDNMAFGLKMRKIPKGEIKKRVEEVAKILDISGYLDRKPAALSGGQRQRVAMGRAIVRSPKVFLFDEPLSNLDAKFKNQMRNEIAKLHARLKATTIYVTHDQVTAMAIADIIVVMRKGIIQQIDTPMRLYNNPINKFVAGFIGAPPMNFFDFFVIENKKDIILCDKSASEQSQANIFIKLSEALKKQISALKKGDSALPEKVCLGIRPEHISLSNSSGKSSDNIIKADIEVIEPLGSISNLYLKTGNKEFICQIEAKLDDNLAAGDSVVGTVNLDRVKLFNIETEEVLG